VLTFFIAGLLFICALSTSITWERTPHPVRRPAFSFHLLTEVKQRQTMFLPIRLSLRAVLAFKCCWRTWSQLSVAKTSCVMRWAFPFRRQMLIVAAIKKDRDDLIVADMSSS